MNKTLSQLGMAMRAGKWLQAMKSCLKRFVRQKQNWLLLRVTLQIIHKKSFKINAEPISIPLVIGFDRESLGQVLVKPERVVLAVTDQGFAKMISKSIGDNVGGGVY